MVAVTSGSLKYERETKANDESEVVEEEVE